MSLLVGRLGGLLKNPRVEGGDYGISVMMVDDYWLALCLKAKGKEADEMVIKVIPIDLACSYINPSTSLETAEVHSSRMAYEGR
jgi:hypothetical protein